MKNFFLLCSLFIMLTINSEMLFAENILIRSKKILGDRDAINETSRLQYAKKDIYSILDNGGYFIVFDAWNFSKNVKYTGIYTQIDDQSFFIVNKFNWPILPKEIQGLVLMQHYYKFFGIIHYYPEINLKKNSNFILKNSTDNINLSALTEENIDLSNFMNPFVKKWAFQSSESDGPNCYHSALATTLFPSLEPQLIETDVIQCAIDNFYTQVEKPELNDIALFYIPYMGTDTQFKGKYFLIHAAVVIGRDEYSPEDIIVFTKNGQKKNEYMFNNIRELSSLKGWQFTEKVHYFRVKNSDIQLSQFEQMCKSNPP